MRKHILLATFFLVLMLLGSLKSTTNQTQASFPLFAESSQNAALALSPDSSLAENHGYELRPISHLGGTVQDLAVSGSNIFQATGARLTVLSATSPNHPRSVGHSETLSDQINDIALDGSYLYAAAAGAGMHVFSIADPHQPESVGVFKPSAYYRAQAIAVAGDLAYVGDTTGLTIVDVSDPTAPRQVGDYRTYDTILRILVSGSHAYVLSSNYLRILNVGDVANPIETGSLTLETLPTHVGASISGTHLMLATGNSELLVIDVAKPDDPFLASTYDLRLPAFDIVVLGTYAFVARGWAVIVLDVSNPINPINVGAHAVPGSANRIATDGNYVYVAEEDSGDLSAFGIDPAPWPYQVGSYQAPGIVQSGTVLGNYAYVASGEAGLRIVDVRRPEEIREIGSTREPTGLGPVNGVFVSGNHAFLARYWGLQIIDISDKSQLRETGRFGTYQTQDVVVSSNIAYLASGIRGLLIVDVTNRTFPTALGAYDTSGSSLGLALTGSHIYLADGIGGLRIIDVSNPALPQEVMRLYDRYQVSDVAIFGSYAYVAAGSGGLRILDVTDPAAPQEVAAPSVSPATRVLVQDDLAFVSTSYSTKVLDVSEPVSAVEKLSYDGDLVPLHFSRPYLYAGATGLTVLELGPISTATISPAGGTLYSAYDYTSYEFGPGTFSDPVTVIHTILNNSQEPLPPGLQLAGHLFENAAYDAEGKQIVAPAEPYTMTLQYDEGEIAPVDEQTLGLYFQDEGGWHQEPTAIVDSANNSIAARPSVFAEWALLGRAPLQTYLPLVLNQFTPRDLILAQIEVTQAIQNEANAVPLVSNRPTVLRVYAETTTASPVDDVFLSVSASRDGVPLPGSPLRVGPWSIFPKPSKAVFGQSFNVHLPETWLSGQVTLAATIDPDDTVHELNEGNNNRSLSASFHDVPPLKIRIVPVNFIHGPTGTFCPAPTEEDITDWVRRTFPLSDIQTSWRTPIEFTGSNLSTFDETLRLLNRITSLKGADGAPGEQVYYGLVSNDWTNWVCDDASLHGGMAWVGMRAAVGGESGETGAHEIGHTFGLFHAPCGSPAGVDPDYPYPDASIGQFGFDVYRNDILSPDWPDYTRDMMSYCGPKWFSDYNYEKLFADQIRFRSPSLMGTAAESFLIRATFNSSGKPALQPVYSIAGLETQTASSGAYHVEFVDAADRVLASHPVPVYSVSEESPEGQAIYAAVPVPAGQVAGVRLLEDSRIVDQRSFQKVLAPLQVRLSKAPGEEIALQWSNSGKPVLVRYKADGQAQWTTLAIDYSGNELSIAIDTLAGPGVIEVRQSDTASAVAGTAAVSEALLSSARSPFQR